MRANSRSKFKEETVHPRLHKLVIESTNCVMDRIESFKKVLSDSNSPRADRIEALKFIVHFVGDVHQPMHATGEAAGGNGIAVTEFGSTQCGKRPCNLHGVWDTEKGSETSNR